MSAVLCLPACLCVSPQRPVARPPTRARQKRFTAAGSPSPCVPLGAFEGYEQHPSPEDSKTITCDVRACDFRALD